MYRYEIPSVVKFNKISADLASVERNDLSMDQKYLPHIDQSISEEKFSFEISLKNPNKMAHSRWFATAYCMLRLYIATENTSNTMKLIVAYIMKVYFQYSSQLNANLLRKMKL